MYARWAKVAKLSNLQKEIETHGTPSILAAKLIDMQETLVGKDKYLK